MNRLTSPIIKLAVLVTAFAAVAAGTATAAKLITGKQIKDHSVTGKDIKAASLGPKALSAAAKATLTGPKGADGAPGATGPAGPAGPSDVFVHRRAEAIVADANTRVVATQTLPAGTYAVRASLLLTTPNGGKTHKCTLRRNLTDLATTQFAQGAGQRDAMTIAGKAEIAEGAAGADAQVRVVCFVDDDKGTAENIVIESIRTTNAVTTDE